MDLMQCKEQLTSFSFVFTLISWFPSFYYSFILRTSWSFRSRYFDFCKDMFIVWKITGYKGPTLNIITPMLTMLYFIIRHNTCLCWYTVLWYLWYNCFSHIFYKTCLIFIMTAITIFHLFYIFSLLTRPPHSLPYSVLPLLL